MNIQLREFTRAAWLFSAVAFFGVAVVLGGDFDLTWWTVDGGGATSSGGGFEVSGTIGQPDAQTPPVMSGSGYELTGGFWPVTDVCALPGDMNGDSLVDGEDIQRFVDCLLGAGSTCGCADLDGGGVGASDVTAFVTALLP